MKKIVSYFFSYCRTCAMTFFIKEVSSCGAFVALLYAVRWWFLQTRSAKAPMFHFALRIRHRLATTVVATITWKLTNFQGTSVPSCLSNFIPNLFTKEKFLVRMFVVFNLTATFCMTTHVLLHCGWLLYFSWLCALCLSVHTCLWQFTREYA